MNSILVLVLAAILVSVNASCTARVTVTPRQGSAWSSNGVNYQVYDISATNSGTEFITSLRITFSYPSTSSIGDAWNYDKSTQLLTNYGGRLNPGQSFNGAGFILIGSGPVTVTAEVATCGNPTQGPTQGPTRGPTQGPTQGPTRGPTQGPTQGPTRGPTQGPTQGPTRGPTQGPTQAPGNCSASYSLTKRDGGSFLENGVPSQIWDLTFRNSGVRPITELRITITPAPNTTVNQNNKWNLVYDPNTREYTVMLFNALYAPQSTYTGAGFVIAGATNSSPSIAIVRTTC